VAAVAGTVVATNADMSVVPTMAGTVTAAGTTVANGAEAQPAVRRFKVAVLLALACIGAASLSGCVVEHRRDGGVEIRPIHVH
jgi:hypothetical protein